MTRQTETTEVGEQWLVDGVRPVSLRERLEAMTDHPMVPRRHPGAAQKACDIGLFDEVGRAQIDLFDVLASPDAEGG